MKHRKIYGFLAAVLCGTAIYLSGYAQGENRRQNIDSKSYSQGYKTGYIKAFREFKRQQMIKSQHSTKSHIAASN